MASDLHGAWGHSGLLLQLLLPLLVLLLLAPPQLLQLLLVPPVQLRRRRREVRRECAHLSAPGHSAHLKPSAVCRDLRTSRSCLHSPTSPPQLRPPHLAASNPQDPSPHRPRKWAPAPASEVPPQDGGFQTRPARSSHDSINRIPKGSETQKP